MEENQKGSPDASGLSKLGSDIKVMNLRPTDKSRHLSEKPYFSHKYQTRAEQLQDESLIYRRVGIYEGDLNLPIPNTTERKIKKINKRRVDDVQSIIKGFQPQNDFEVKKLQQNMN